MPSKSTPRQVSTYVHSFESFCIYISQNFALLAIVIVPKRQFPPPPGLNKTDTDFSAPPTLFKTISVEEEATVTPGVGVSTLNCTGDPATIQSPSIGNNVQLIGVTDLIPPLPEEGAQEIDLDVECHPQ